MTERDQTASGQPIRLDAYQSVPAARPLSDFHVEQVGDDLVILDGETLQYHTLNQTAALIWRACDGVVTPAQMAKELSVPREVLESAIAELGEAGLLQSPSSNWDAALTRRRAAKLIAAGLAGVVGLPLIKSITAPDSAAAFTLGQCMSIPGAIGLCTPFTGVCNRQCRDLGYIAGGCLPDLGGGDGCCICIEVNAPSVGGEESVIDDTTDVQMTSVENDPLLGDEDGNVDVNSIQTDSVEQAVETDDVPATDVPVDTTSGADTSADSSGGDSETVQTSSDSEEAPTEEANG